MEVAVVVGAPRAFNLKAWPMQGVAVFATSKERDRIAAASAVGTIVFAVQHAQNAISAEPIHAILTHVPALRDRSIFMSAMCDRHEI
jgi:hypothetical protein